MEKLLVSACLLGKRVRYDGGSLALTDQIVERWLSEGRIVSVCPEVEAGMSIPRKPAEIVAGDGEKVLSGEAMVAEKGGGEVTDEFITGAQVALELCHRFHIKVAVLAEFSPSCGSSAIYDGSFSGKKVPGMGVTAALLRRHGVRVFSQYEVAAADEMIRSVGE
ncbi:DUF523 domain-containing protein [Bisbaumannia pacifica]|uniref:DUF523 domain-containing protein n=1 Tax=Bisbaumannia pacifica TaxID=77098 RepID=A0ABD4L2I2_9GAMM|nr:DUF523 domain-containing protein [Halomonas pacifica]MBH8580478.1 DUF523 domain-containing protein [Halomonas pacifica]